MHQNGFLLVGTVFGASVGVLTSGAETTLARSTNYIPIAVIGSLILSSVVHRLARYSSHHRGVSFGPKDCVADGHKSLEGDVKESNWKTDVDNDQLTEHYQVAG